METEIKSFEGSGSTTAEAMNELQKEINKVKLDIVCLSHHLFKDTDGGYCATALVCFK